jgi:hypothetical protein
VAKRGDTLDLQRQLAGGEARRLNPKLTVKWMMEHRPALPTALEGVRKAGLPEE